MPNHVTNIIIVADQGDHSLAEIRASFVSKDGRVDFNVIEPSPACLDDFNPHMGITTLAEALVSAPISTHPLTAALEASNRQDALDKMDELSAEDAKLLERALSNHEECGHIYWHSWQSEKWGTKWNAYGQPDKGHPEDSTAFEFETAWSHPQKLLAQLSRKLPAVTFEIKFADEDIGSNCGAYTLVNGEVSNADIAPNWRGMSGEQKKHYTKLAFGICHKDTDPRSYGYDEDWQYSDEVYDAYEAEQEEQA